MTLVVIVILMSFPAATNSLKNSVVNFDRYIMKFYFEYLHSLNESIFLDVLHFPMKNIKLHDLEATPMGGATSNQPVTLFRHDVQRENLTFWLFQNYVKSDLLSNNMKMSDDMCN